MKVDYSLRIHRMKVCNSDFANMWVAVTIFCLCNIFCSGIGRTYLG